METKIRLLSKLVFIALQFQKPVASLGSACLLHTRANLQATDLRVKFQWAVHFIGGHNLELHGGFPGGLFWRVCARAGFRSPVPPPFPVPVSSAASRPFSSSWCCAVLSLLSSHLPLWPLGPALCPLSGPGLPSSKPELLQRALRSSALRTLGSRKLPLSASPLPCAFARSHPTCLPGLSSSSPSLRPGPNASRFVFVLAVCALVLLVPALAPPPPSPRPRPLAPCAAFAPFALPRPDFNIFVATLGFFACPASFV